MEGLTVRSAEGLIDTGYNLKDLKNKGMKNEVLGSPSSSSKSFSETLNDAVKNVNHLQKTADVKMEQLATGKARNIPEVMIAAEKADIALKLMVQVRNKIIDAYQEIMKMPV